MMFRALKSQWSKKKHQVFQWIFKTRLRFQYPDMTIYTSQRNMLRLFKTLYERDQFSVIETNVNLTRPVHGKEGFQTLLNTKNGGGSSMYSEALSIEVLSRLLGVGLYKTEMELKYGYPNTSDNGGSGPLMDYACHYRNDQSVMTVGVSVTRAMSYARAYTAMDAHTLLNKKLKNMVRSSENIINTKFDRHILHIWTASGKNASLIRRQCKKLNGSIHYKNTIVLISIVNHQLVFFNNQHLNKRSVRLFYSLL